MDGVITADDIGRWRQEPLEMGQARVLEMLATGRPLAEVLEALVRLIENQREGMLGSVLLLDHGRLFHAAAPSLPQEYARAIDGLEIGPDVGSCGAAAFRRTRVIVEDIERDDLWAEYRAVARQHGLAACWSQPIFAADGRVLGTFAMYYREPRRPDEQDLELIERASHVAGIAVERTRSEHALREANQTLERRVAQRTLELQKAQDNLRQRQAELAHALRVNTAGELAGGLAHELSQPLSAIMSHAGACLESGRSGQSLPEHCIDDLDRIVEQADRASQIIQRLRSLMRKGRPVHELVSIQEILEGIVPLITAEAREQAVELRIKGGKQPLHVLADKIQIQQVILNLVHNSIEAMAGIDQGNRLLSIEVLQRSVHEVDVVVEDSGSGLAEEMVEQVFQPFYTTKPTGMGLGLSLARRIVDSHRGRVWATPKSDSGATFQFALPVVQGSISAAGDPRFRVAAHLPIEFLRPQD
jgi:signal transduction histidine kinase